MAQLSELPGIEKYISKTSLVRSPAYIGPGKITEAGMTKGDPTKVTRTGSRQPSKSSQPPAESPTIVRNIIVGGKIIAQKVTERATGRSYLYDPHTDRRLSTLPAEGYSLAELKSVSKLMVEGGLTQKAAFSRIRGEQGLTEARLAGVPLRQPKPSGLTPLQLQQVASLEQQGLTKPQAIRQVTELQMSIAPSLLVGIESPKKLEPSLTQPFKAEGYKFYGEHGLLPEKVYGQEIEYLEPTKLSIPQTEEVPQRYFLTSEKTGKPIAEVTGAVEFGKKAWQFVTTPPKTQKEILGLGKEKAIEGGFELAKWAIGKPFQAAGVGFKDIGVQIRTGVKPIPYLTKGAKELGTGVGYGFEAIGYGLKEISTPVGLATIGTLPYISRIKFGKTVVSGYASYSGGMGAMDVKRPIPERIFSGMIGVAGVTGLGSELFTKGYGYATTIRKTELAVEKITPPEVLAGKKRFPIAPTKTHYGLFQKGEYNLPITRLKGYTGKGELIYPKEYKKLPFKIKPSGYHATAQTLRRTIGKGESEIPGLYISHAVSPHFLRLGKITEYPTKFTILPQFQKPKIAAITPTKFVMGKSKIPGVAGVPAIKTEVEAVLPPQTKLIPSTGRYYFKYRGQRVPIQEYVVEEPKLITKPKTKTTTAAKIKKEYYLPEEYVYPSYPSISSYKPSKLSSPYKLSKLSRPSKPSYPYTPSIPSKPYKLSKLSRPSKPSKPYKPPKPSYPVKPSTSIPYKQGKPYSYLPPPSKPYFPPPPKTPPPPTLRVGFKLGKYKLPTQIIPRKTRYTPSLVAVEFGLRGARQKRLTGLEIRKLPPLTKKKKKKRRKGKLRNDKKR